MSAPATRSYYGRPILKEPTWTWEVPCYLFAGGLAGAGSTLALAARLAGNERLSRTALSIAAVADAASPVLLVSDLGRPERFVNMLRVFKVTSPMSIGSWVLVVSGGASNTAAVLELTGRLPRLKRAAESVAALLGPALATYTGALLAQTAIPVWHEARRELPFVFGASGAASAGAACAALLPPADAGPARRLAIGAVAAEVTAMHAMERRLGMIGEVYRKGTAGMLSRVSKALTLGGATLLAARGRRSRAAASLGGALVLGGELGLRWSVYKAGFQSARDPKYVVEPQRQRIAERGAAKAVTKPAVAPEPANP